MLPLILILIIFILILVYGFLKPNNFPPGPVKLPFVGFLPFMDPNLPHKKLLELTKDYGDAVGIFIGSKPTVICNSFESIKAVLSQDDLQGRPKGTLIDDRTWGKTLGIMFTEGEVVQGQRRFSLHQFRNLGFGKRSHEAVILDDLYDLCDEISAIKGPFHLPKLLGVSAINVLWAIMGGTRFRRDDPKLHELVFKINQLFQNGAPFGNIVAVFPILKYIIPELSGYNKIINGFISVRDFIKESVDEHKKTFDEENIRDFFDSYLLELKNTQDPNFSEEQLVAVSMDVFAAGVETSSSLVSFIIMYMCLYPDIQSKVQKEIDNVIGRDRFATMNDRSSLLYTDAVYHEVIRIRSPAPLTVPHIAMRDTEFMGYNIPKETMFFVNLYSLYMNPDHWKDPEVFYPERFIVDGKIKRDETFIPFGKGKRSCLGEGLARTTTFLTYCALLQRFNFTVDPNTPIIDTEGKLGFTLQPPFFNFIVEKRT